MGRNQLTVVTLQRERVEGNLSWEEIAFQSKNWLRDEGEKFLRVTDPSTPYLAQLGLPQDVIH